MNWQTKAESKFENLAKIIVANPIKIIITILLVSFSLISNLPKIKIDTSTEGFLHKEDPALIRYESFKKQFGQDEKVMVIVEGKNIFDLAFLKKLKKLHTELEENIPHLEDITSLLNARNTRGENDSLIVEDLYEKFPTTKKQQDFIKELAINNKMYKNLLFNEKLTLTTIILEPNAYENSESDNELDGFGDEDDSEKDLVFLEDSSKSEMIRKAQEIAKKFSSDDFRVFISGSLAVNDYNKQSVQKDMRKFIVIVLITMMIFLFVVFRRISAVVLPIFVVALSLLSTIGIMALVGTPFTIPTQIIPSFLLAVGIGAVVHLLAMFFNDFNKNGDNHKAIIYALSHSGLPIVMTSLTTAGGLLSFGTGEIAPIADLGIFASIGVLIALVNTLILLPAILTLVKFKQAPQKQQENSKKMDKLLISIADFSFKFSKQIILASFLIAIFFLYQASQVEFKHDPLSWQPDSSPIKQSTFLVDKELKGSVTMEVIIDTKKENGLYNSELLTKIDTIRKKAESIQNNVYFVGKGWSVAEVLKEIHKALHNNDEKYYAITKNDALIPQEFLLFENSGSDDLEDLVDSSFSKARITFKLPWMEAGEYKELNDKLKKLITDELNDDSIEVVITGMVPLFQRTLVAAMDTMSKSYVIAFIAIAIMMIILLGDIKLGLVSMIPNILPVVMTVGFMNLANMPLDLFTMLVGAIVIGLSVDDTVHYFHNFSKYQKQGKSVKESVELTMLGTGRALVATTVILALGFYVYMFASLQNLINFGILTGGAISIALISNIILGPALLTLITKDKK